MKPGKPTKIVSKERILRAVASSSAIKANETVSPIEDPLKK